MRQYGKDDSVAFPQCPEGLRMQLEANGLRPDLATDATGNCGVDGFLRSARAVGAVGPSKQHRGKEWQAIRNVGRQWLLNHRNDVLWGGMTVQRLCETLSGNTNFENYCDEMARPGTWVDTCFLHTIGCVHKVDIILFQLGMSPAWLGWSMHKIEAEAEEDPVAVPMALMNDRHFWGVLLGAGDEQPEAFVDKGDPFFAEVKEEKGRRPPFCEGFGEQGLASDTGLPHCSVGSQGATRNTLYVDRELALCQALACWNPWQCPTTELVDAMAPLAEDPEHGKPQALPARKLALSQFALEQAHANTMGDHLTFERGARWHIERPEMAWHGLGVKRRRVMDAFRRRASARFDVDKVLNSGCSRGSQPHTCLHSFSPQQVINWRILWHSMPKFMRHELLIKEASDQIAEHRRQGLADSVWQLRFSFLGVGVCRVAFLALTGIGAPFLQDCRKRGLEGKPVWTTRGELGLWRRIADHVWPQKYLDARQWLLEYAEKHASWNPGKSSAHLPSGRRSFYYAQYEHDRSQVQGRRPQHEEGGGCKRKRDFESYIADEKTFLKAWATELPWLRVDVSLGSFVHCGLCEYLRMLIDQTQRGPLREAFKSRLGEHFAFQAAQRLAQGRLEEVCAQSGGRKWFMKIDKMDNTKAVCPTVYSQLSAPFFKDLSLRLVTGIIGSMWHGTLSCQHHVRTLFDDCEHGSEMQCSAILENLWDVSRTEGHLPEDFYIGADNTYKETKNQHMINFLVWLLCVLERTPLRTITLCFLMVGHTHDALDRFFSRLVMALRGRNWITVEEMLGKLRQGLSYTTVRHGHLRQVWAWKELLRPDALGQHPLHGLRFVHCIELSRRNHGIAIRWKQWLSDTTWSEPVIICPAERVAATAAVRPRTVPMNFQNAQAKLEWLNRFERWCADLPEEVLGGDVARRVGELRKLIYHQTPGAYAPGVPVETFVEGLLRHGGAQAASAPIPILAPGDGFSEMFPGSDPTPVPPEALLRIEGVTHTTQGRSLQKSDIIHPGSNMVVRVPPGTTIDKTPIQFLAAVAMQSPSEHTSADKCLVAWFWPPKSRRQSNKLGRKPEQIDIFGSWVPLADVPIKTLRAANLPDPVVSLHDVLDANFHWTAERELPYDTLDTLRLKHGIDVTGLSTSLTHRGNLYRAYVLHRGG